MTAERLAYRLSGAGFRGGDAARHHAVAAYGQVLSEAGEAGGEAGGEGAGADLETEIRLLGDHAIRCGSAVLDQ